MGIFARTVVVLVLGVTACSGRDGLPTEQGTGNRGTTGLEGTVRRGPIRPVCREGEPCDAPLQVSFLLEQDGHIIGRFASDSAGHFLVYAAPGTYVVVPEQPIGLTPQTPEVQVDPTGLTHVDLLFDTGIR